MLWEEERERIYAMSAALAFAMSKERASLASGVVRELSAEDVRLDATLRAPGGGLSAADEGKGTTVQKAKQASASDRFECTVQKNQLHHGGVLALSKSRQIRVTRACRL